jgi:hypothetical protein
MSLPYIDLALSELVYAHFSAASLPQKIIKYNGVDRYVLLLAICIKYEAVYLCRSSCEHFIRDV